MRSTGYAALVYVRLSDGDAGTMADDEFVDRVEEAVVMALDRSPRAGLFDGHEFGDGWATIFCYGEDGALLAERVTSAVLPFDLPQGSCIVLRHGHPAGIEDAVLADLSGVMDPN